MGQGLVIVAVRDKEHVDDLVKVACRMAKADGSELLAVSVAEIGPALPLDAESDLLDQPAKDALERAAAVAAQSCGIKLRTRMLRAREAGPALVDEAKEHHADLLVLGYHGRHGLAGGISEILLGSCVQHVAVHAPCRVILEITPHSAKSAD